ncbi:MAG: hypothetical protein P1V81_08190 [Planctomycetota bacterium]|nr:hypothetical protein [Planctomycetota bacterium]
MVLGVLLLGVDLGWSADGPERSFVGSLFGLQLLTWAPDEARALCASFAPGVAGPSGLATALGWLHLVAAFLAGAWFLPRWLQRLAGGGPGGLATRVGLGMALVLATSPWMPHFVATRTADGAEAYLDLGDLAFGLGASLLVAGLLLLRGPRPAQGAPAGGDAESPGAFPPGPLLVAAVALAALAPLLLSRAYLGGEPLTNDGVAYRWQAELFAEGQLARDLGPVADFFPARQLLPQRHAGGATSKYPPGHSAFLAPGTAIGAPRLLPQLLAGLSVLLVWRLGLRLTRRRDLALAAAWAFALSPMLLGVSSLWLSHATSLPTGLVFAVAWLAAWARARGDEPGSGIPPALLAGVALSACLAARPLTAAALAAALATYTLVDLTRDPRGRLGTQLFAMAAAVLGLLPGLLAFLAVNAAITGSPWKPAYELYADLLSPNDRWGLSNLATALPFTAYNLARLAPWLLGGPLAYFVLVLGWRQLRADPDELASERRSQPFAQHLVWGVPFALLVLYSLHRFQGIPWFGPLYLVEALPFLAVAAGAGVLALARGLGLAASSRGLLCLPLLLGSLALLHPHLERAAERSAIRRAPAVAAAAELQRLAAERPGEPARLLVFVPVESPGQAKRFPLPPPSVRVAPASANLRPARWPVFARDLGPRNQALWQLFDHPRAMRWSHARQELEPLQLEPDGE